MISLCGLHASRSLSGFAFDDFLGRDRLSLAVGVSFEEVVPEVYDLFTLVSDSTRVTIVRDFYHCRSCWGSQQSFLELNLLEKELVGLEGRQLVLALHVQEMFS